MHRGTPRFSYCWLRAKKQLMLGPPKINWYLFGHASDFDLFFTCHHCHSGQLMKKNHFWHYFWCSLGSLNHFNWDFYHMCYRCSYYPGYCGLQKYQRHLSLLQHTFGSSMEFSSQESSLTLAYYCSGGLEKCGSFDSRLIFTSGFMWLGQCYFHHSHVMMFPTSTTFEFAEWCLQTSVDSNLY